MITKTSYYLDDDTMNNIDQVNSIPIHLPTLVTMLIDKLGIPNQHFSRHALTVAQLIQTNFCKKQKP